jgi:hypothetical protein
VNEGSKAAALFKRCRRDEHTRKSSQLDVHPAENGDVFVSHEALPLKPDTI